MTRLDGFPDLETAWVILTHPLVGVLHRRDGLLGTYHIWHDRLHYTTARVLSARIGLFDRLGSNRRIGVGSASDTGFARRFFATPRRPVDPIAVSTVVALFVVSPGAMIAALLMRLFLPRNRPLLRSVSIPAVRSQAAPAWAGDFWLIGIHAGQKSNWLTKFFLPTVLFIAMTAYQWPRRYADTYDPQPKPGLGTHDSGT